MTELSELLVKLDAESQEAVVKALRAAKTAREHCEVGQEGDGPEELHKRLLLARANIDRLEHIAAELGRLKAKSQQAVADCRDEYDQAFADSATDKTVGFSDYATAKEKEAHHDLKAMKQKMAMRKAERRHRDIDSAWEYVRLMHRGAEGVRKDLDTRIRLITLAGQLDR